MGVVLTNLNALNAIYVTGPATEIGVGIDYPSVAGAVIRLSGGGSQNLGNYQLVQNQGVTLNGEGILNFSTGLLAVDDPVNGRTTVTATGGGVLSGLASARPSATGSKALYFCDDVPVIYFDDPNTTAWKQYGIVGRTVAPGAIGGWTVTGTLGLAQKGDSILATAAGISPGQINTLTQAIPSALTSAGNWIVQADGYLMAQTGAGYGEFGACITNGVVSGTSVARYMIRYEQSFGWKGAFGTIGTQTHTDLRAFDNSFGNISGAPILRTRLFNDGTTLFYQISGDGEFWRTWTSENMPGGYTQFGAMVGVDVSTGVAAALIETMRAIAPTTAAVSAATGNGTIATITTSTAHGLQTGMGVSVRGITGGTGTPPNASFDVTPTGTGNQGVTVLSPTQFTVPYTPAFTYGSGGTVFALSQ